MKKIPAVVAASLVLMGCSLMMSQVSKNNQAINVADGINQEEALLIAQNTLLSSGYKSYDGIIPAKLREDEAALKYPDFWFVDYSPNANSSRPSLLIAIDKKTGTAHSIKEYWPSVVKDLDWVFKYDK